MTLKREEVILVDENDRELGTMEKIEAHQKAALHRAFSVFLFNSKGELLLQQRAMEKYHAPGLWTNTCCSHQRPGEDNLDAAKRRLMEELGISAEVSNAFTFTYKADMGNGLTEHEFDHVMVGQFEGDCYPDESEVKAWTYVSLDVIEQDLQHNPGKYTPWFKIVFNRLREYMYNQKAA